MPTQYFAEESDYLPEVIAIVLRSVLQSRFRSLVQRFQVARAVSQSLESAAGVRA